MKKDLKTLADILAIITPENIDNFLIDFRGWLVVNMLVDETQKLVGKENIYNQEREVMHWIDDGKTNAHIHIN